MSFRDDARTMHFEKVTVLGKSMIFTNFRVDRKTVPEELYMYEVRHDDDCQGDPCQIGEWIMVNHWGTLISKEPLPLVKSSTVENSYLDIDPDKDWNYEAITCTLEEYIHETVIPKKGAGKWTNTMKT